MTVPAITGPTPKTCVRLVPEALTAAASFFPGITQLDIQVTQVGQELGGELGPGQRDGTGRRGLRQDPGGLSCGYLLLVAARDQVAEHGVQPGRATWLRVRARSRCRLDHTFSTAR